MGHRSSLPTDSPNLPDAGPALSLEHILGVLRRRWPVVVLVTILAAAATFGWSEHQTKKYTATASLVFNNDQVSQQVAGLQATSSSDPQAQQGTNVKLVELGPMATETARTLDHGLTRNRVLDNLSVSSETNTNIVHVSATSTSPVLATEIANTYTSDFVREQQAQSSAYFSSALALVNKQLGAMSSQQRVGPAGLALEDRAQSLTILAQIQSGNVRVAEAAIVPKAPSSPRIKRDSILGGLLGLIVGLGIAFLLERLDRRIKEPEDLERLFRLPVLGTIPESHAYHQSASRRGRRTSPLPAPETEAFGLLRARLRYFNVDRDLRLVMVVSASPGDGKSTVVQYLAESAASVGSRVLIVEADMRRPTLGDRLGINPMPGLAEVLISAVAVEDAIQEVPLTVAAARMTGAGSLACLTAGVSPPNPNELVESHAMERVLSWAAEAFDLVIIDTPPLTIVPDAIPLLSKSHGVVIVSRLGRTTRDVAERTRDELSRLGAHLLGVVANGFRVRDLTDRYASAYYQAAPAEAAQSHSNEEEQSAVHSSA